MTHSTDAKNHLLLLLCAVVASVVVVVVVAGEWKKEKGLFGLLLCVWASFSKKSGTESKTTDLLFERSKQ